MKIRKITSLTALVSFVLLLVTSTVLYIVPQGRVAYWTDWRLWGLSKSQWGNIHINLGVLLLLAVSFHIYYNWKPITSYLKDKGRKLKIFTKEFNLALVISMIFIAGTYFQAPPFIWIIQVSESIKDAGARKYGEPPYGHAELSSFKTFTARMGFDPEESMERLKRAGIRIESQRQTIQEIAGLNNLTSQQVYQAMKPAETSDEMKKLPESPKPGLGKLLLSDLCQEYHLDSEAVLKALEKNKIKASKDLTIKQIADQNNLNPIDIYEIIKKAEKSL